MNKDLTVGDPAKVLWKFCLPLFGSIIFQQAFHFFIITPNLSEYNLLFPFKIIVFRLCQKSGKLVG